MKAKSKNLYIIGDVHGCYDTLLALIEKLPDKKAELVFVGDLVDRGENSAEVVAYVKKNKHHCILGNHDLMMLEALNNQNYFQEWSASGGEETLKSYEKGAHNIKKHLRWLEKLPFYLEFDIGDEKGFNLLVTHGAGLPFYENLQGASKLLCTNRTMVENSYKIINVFGHSPFREVKFYKNYIGIDTGCVYGKEGKAGFLSALEWPSKKVYSQSYIG